ncbi:MAG: M20/M25/M40 family metallo-hydrolase [Desulfobacterota bacterium]|nr:M20/M25/M40 family metallo-hydrolase [Thermodesulfobacteriota bacterium]
MDWDLVLKEATSYLQEYIRINTVNPPGNEIEGAKFLKKIFDAEGIPSQIYEPSPGRGSLLATLRGEGSKRPLLLLHHIDVVPVEKEAWDVPPFEGVIKDGFLYGRGTLDCKSLGILELMVLLLLKRQGIPLKRDLLFFAAADEETGGRWGVQWAMENVPALKEAEYALNEGGHIILDDNGTPDRYALSNGQKVIFQLQLKARGTSGHGSMPLGDNPNVKMVQALNSLTRWETPFHVIPTVREYFRRMAPKQPPYEREFFEDIEKGLQDATFTTWLISNPVYNAMLRNTLSLTVLKGGTKANVIPSESSAILDCRLIPGTDKERFLKEVKARLGEEIEVSVLSESQSLPPSPLDTELYRAIEAYASENDPGCPIVPFLLPGATDSRFLREQGIITYDFCPLRLTEKELMRVHGHNERIGLKTFGLGLKAMFGMVQRVAS